MRVFRLASAAFAAVAFAVSTASAAISIGPATTPFVDISVTGTLLTPNSDDAEHTITAAALTGAGFAGNGLLAGGQDIVVGNNGAIIWNSTAAAHQVGYVNRTDFPTMPAANGADTGNGNGTRQMLAVLWDDNTPGTGGSLRWQVIGGNLIVQWTNEDHFNATGTGTVTYEAIIYGGNSIASGLPLVDYVYNDTLYGANAYQNDGGSATIGYKNWGVNGAANDVEFGLGGGNNTISDPAFGGANMQPKVAGYIGSANPALPNAVRITPEPGSLGLIALGALALLRRR